MNVALVYDRINKFGGAERVVQALHELWPSAPLFTAVYDPVKASWAKGIQVEPSILQQWPLPKGKHDYYPYLMPWAFESFSFDDYDVVISVTSAEAKGIITKPHTLHICYLLTPTRYLWSDHEEYQKDGFSSQLFSLKRLIFPAQSFLRLWDQIASARPDRYIAISETVVERLRKYYKQESEIIHPPVDTDFFQPGRHIKSSDYFLVVSRLVASKRLDIIIDVFNTLGWKLKIIGSGNQERNLRLRAGQNIVFLGGNLTDTDLLGYYQSCCGVIAAGKEDFGLTLLEALSCGKGVIAYKEGGYAETIIDKKTGILFYPQTYTALYSALVKFKESKFAIKTCREYALLYRKKLFAQKFKDIVKKYNSEYRHNLSNLS